MKRLKLRIGWLLIVLASLMFTAVSAQAQEDCVSDIFWLGILDVPTSAGGSGYNFGEWYYYQNTDWWNQWFYNAPYNPNRRKEIFVNVTVMPMWAGAPSFVEIAYNWSTPEWSELGLQRPPLPDDVPDQATEDLYIKRHTFFVGELFEPILIEPEELYVIPDYNPEWVSIDIRGTNFMILQDMPGTILHCCVPKPAEACCFSDGSCQDLPPDTCLGQGGDPQGAGTDCDTTDCPQPTEACCFPDGSCQDLPAGTCLNQGGEPQGAGTDCATTDCPQPATQACCLPDGTCVDSTVDDCLAQGGTSQGPDTDCSMVDCGCIWNIDDDHKMHWPQLPKLGGWDVEFSASTLADDWQCSGTRDVNDIHFWVSWAMNMLQPINNFTVTIYSDVPDPDGNGPLYSMPGEALWVRTFAAGDFTIHNMPEDLQGWHDPSVGYWVPEDHTLWQQIDICNIPDPFVQEQGTVYWLGISFGQLPFVGWKESGSDLFNDDGVWWDQAGQRWKELRDPTGGLSLDLAFVITPKKAPTQQVEYGDAPEDSMAYPSLGVIGNFPTCIMRGPAGFIQHGSRQARFEINPAPGWDAELDGNAGLCPLQPGCFPPYDQDECFMDGDAGLMYPEPFTINALLSVVPCPQSLGTPLGVICNTGQWGVNAEIRVVNQLPTDAYVNVLADWNQDGQWTGLSACPGGGAADEHILKNLPVPSGYAGLLSALGAGQFLIGPNPGYVWFRFTITESPVPLPGWTGDGIFYHGETEDYLLLIEEGGGPEYLDFGDAPDPQYPTLVANNGARHAIAAAAGVYMGALVDAEGDGQPNATATGDDVNGVPDDEDGVVFTSALIPGQMATVDVTASIAGFLDAWVDFGDDGSWAEAGDQIFASKPLVAGLNSLSFSVPGTAKANVTTYARFRFSGQGGLSYVGAASNGEVEDYMVDIRIPSVGEPKQPVEHLKWSQPPIEIDPTSSLPVYCGWDEPSWTTDPCGLVTLNSVADDFFCLGRMPVTSIHWWGSYIEWYEPYLPPQEPNAWLFKFWTNVPASADIGYSHPGKLLWQVLVDASRVSTERVGVDEFPDMMPETCFQYYVDLEPNEFFWQEDYNNVTDDNIYWLGITAVYPNDIDIDNPWGWKTRQWSWMDDAVTYDCRVTGYEPCPDDPLRLCPIVECQYWPMEEPIFGESVDVAFELDTDPNYIKWEQAYTGMRHWSHYEDELSMATEKRYIDKWLQPPDLTPTGVDVDMYWVPLADDFRCNQTGPVSYVRMWGSFADDILPAAGVGSLTFQVTIYSDIPADPPLQPWSKPGNIVWGPRVFGPGEYTVNMVHQGPEDWYDPATNMYRPANHQLAFQYDFAITGDPFIQQEGTIYWLEVKDLPHPPPPDRDYTFGWKTTTIDHRWNDDAVFDYWLPDPPPPPLIPGWNPMVYPEGHQYQLTTLDLSFEIETVEEEFVIERMIADDWKCERKTPVTAAVWWGSYIGYGSEACNFTGPWMSLPVKPDYFLLSIWTNIPAGEPGTQ